MLTLQAEDGSLVSVSDMGSSGSRLELRASAGAALLASQIVSSDDIDAAIARALQ